MATIAQSTDLSRERIYQPRDGRAGSAARHRADRSAPSAPDHRHAEPVTIVFGATDDEVEGRPPSLAAFPLARAVIGDIEDGYCCCTETHNRNLFEPKLC